MNDVSGRDAALIVDRTYFDAHPQATTYVRRIIPGELSERVHVNCASHVYVQAYRDPTDGTLLLHTRRPIVFDGLTPEQLDELAPHIRMLDDGTPWIPLPVLGDDE